MHLMDPRIPGEKAFDRHGRHEIHPMTLTAAASTISPLASHGPGTARTVWLPGAAAPYEEVHAGSSS